MDCEAFDYDVVEQEELCYVDPEVSSRCGGPQGDEVDDEAAAKAAERERKKAEVRARLQEAGKAKKAKKGFLTPERKKKLRKLLMQKAAEDLKEQQLKKEQERQRILQERIVKMPDVDAISDASQLQEMIKDFHQRIIDIESVKYDLDYEVRQKDFEFNEMTISVNDLRGKFVKPSLKKVSSMGNNVKPSLKKVSAMGNKFKKLQSSEDKKKDFRSNLKQAKKDDVLEELLGAVAEVDEPAPAAEPEPVAAAEEEEE